ncbi:tetraacyldisaccharide 4'-kinase [bacterium]|nr:MAG: tetraacyldisaccharide 4'-kinase [bacterium]
MRTYLYNLVNDRETGFTAGIIKAILFMLSLIYALVVRVLSFFYLFRPLRLGPKLISVGNITWGGTGKTPLVEYICRLLSQEGRKIVILSRGYKREKDKRIGSASAVLGDEAYMLAKNLGDIPVIVDADRVRGANLALSRYHPDILVLDDGLQQWRMKKDLEIITIDAVNPFGNHRLIPRGILREPLSALKRAGIFILTKTDLVPDTEGLSNYLSKVNPIALIAESIHQPVDLYRIGQPQERLSLTVLRGRRLGLISGISYPEGFESLIKRLGADIVLTFRFSDHYYYSKKDLEDISSRISRQGIDTVVTTEKDSVRFVVHDLSCVGLKSVDFFVLQVKIKITKNEEGFRNRLLSL